MYKLRTNVLNLRKWSINNSYIKYSVLKKMPGFESLIQPFGIHLTMGNQIQSLDRRRISEYIFGHSFYKYTQR